MAGRAEFGVMVQLPRWRVVAGVAGRDVEVDVLVPLRASAAWMALRRVICGWPLTVSPVSGEPLPWLAVSAVELTMIVVPLSMHAAGWCTAC